MTDEEFPFEEPAPDPRPVQRPSIWPPFLAYLLSIVLTVVSGFAIGIVLAVVFLAGGGNQKQLEADLAEAMATPPVFVIVALASQLSFLLTAIAFAYFAPVRPLGGLGFKFERSAWPVWGYPILAVGTLVPMAIGLLAATAVSWVIPQDNLNERVLGQLTPLGAVPFILFIALVPGFVEEAFFRGYIQRRLLARWPAWLAILVTSILFGVVHFDPVNIAFAFVIGLWLGVVAYKAGSIWPAVLCHASINAASCSLYLGTRFGIIPDPPPVLATGLVIVVALACFVGSIWMLVRRPAVPLVYGFEDTVRVEDDLR